MQCFEDIIIADEVAKEQQCVENLRIWVDTEAKFYGRTDEAFLLVFLRGCNWNTEKSKKKMYMYYESRKKIPQWWSNRNLENLTAVSHNKPSIILSDSDPDLPSIAVTYLSKFGNDSKLFDAFMKQHSIILELAIRRPNWQKNGIIWDADAKDIPLWGVMKSLNPKVVYSLLKSYCLAIPIRLKAVHVLNAPALAHVTWRLVRPMLSEKMRKRFYFHYCDWPVIKDHVDDRLLPLEFGGSNGTLREHEAALDEEMRAFSDYLLDDEKYGFKLPLNA